MFANKIKELRLQAGFTQIVLASKLNVSQSAVVSWENNERMPTIKKTIEIADLFGVSLDYLFERNILKEKEKIMPEYLLLAKELQEKEISPYDVKIAIKSIVISRNEKNK